MKIETLEYFKKWYDEYYKTFLNETGEVLRNINLKYQHTKNVCFLTGLITETADFTEEEKRIAESVALFHDLGRFEQFKKYRTFSDKLSVNHAELAVKILSDNGVLDVINTETSDLIKEAVLNHNTLEISPEIKSGSRIFAEVIRDADKLDIFRIFSEYYSLPEKDESVALHLKDNDEYSVNLIDDILEGRTVRYDELKYVNDFKLLQLSWVYNINFKKSFEIINDRGYLEHLYESLPKDSQIEMVYKRVQEHLYEKCGLIKN